MAYYVYNKSEGKPIKKHQTYESALQEAKRLALTEGKKIKILEIVTEVRAETNFVVRDLRQDVTPELPFKIKSVFLAKDRLNELDEVPKLPNGDIDYWKATEMLCKKDGGRLPSMEELAQLASYIYGTDIEPYEDYYDLEIKNIPPELAPIYEEQGCFGLWSGREGSAAGAYKRSFGSSCTVNHNLWRGNAVLGVCLEE